MTKLSEKELRRVTSELIDSPGITEWLVKSRMRNLEMMEEAESLDAVRLLQGENRVIKALLSKIPPEEL